MKSKLTAVIGVVIGTALVGMAVRNTPAEVRPATVAQDNVRRTSPAELAALMARGEVIVIDVRDVDSYLAGHIEGALQIPLSYIAGEVPYLRRGKPIVTYCT
jgi:predicted sulfurtransferase